MVLFTLQYHLSLQLNKKLTFTPINRKNNYIYIFTSMKKPIIIFLLFVAAVLNSFAETPDFDPQLKITTNDDLTVDDFYDIKGDLKITFPAADDVDIIFKDRT